MRVIPQYTIRNMPEPIDRYLRSRAKQTGRSLNQTIIDELSERAGKTRNGNHKSLSESLDWFLGSGMDQETIDALEAEDKIRKQIAYREVEELQD